MNRLVPVLCLLSSVALGAGLSAEATARYQQASAAIAARQYPQALDILNALATQNPQVAEIYASRCSVLVAQQRWAAAEADCGYALRLKVIPEALYSLAVAEENQGKAASAAGHYQEYAGSPGVSGPYRDRALARVSALSGVSPTPPPPPPIASAPVVAAAPRGAAGWSKLYIYKNHRMAGGTVTLVIDNRYIGTLSLGQYVELDVPYGQHVVEARSQPRDAWEMPRVHSLPIQVGAYPKYLNFDTQSGQVVMQEMSSTEGAHDVREECSRAYGLAVTDNLPFAPAVAPRAQAVVIAPMGIITTGPAPECRRGSDGRNTCGYNCRLGSDGHFYCASVANGQCALNSDGSWSCP
jgi:hypothetical protein